MHAIVIDVQGYKVNNVVLLGDEKQAHGYELKGGESIIEQDWATANTMNRPKWDGEKWVETEPFPEEEPVIPEPTFEELQTEYNVDLDYRLSIIEMGL